VDLVGTDQYPINSTATRSLLDHTSADSVGNKSRIQTRPRSGRARLSLVEECGRSGRSSRSDRQWDVALMNESERPVAT